MSIVPTDTIAFASNNLQRLPAHAQVALRIAVILIHWDRNARTRKALVTLDAHHCRDIGITPQMAAVEAAKPFWKCD